MANLLEKQFDPKLAASDFPILSRRIYKDKPLVYLDNAASTQHPRQVIQAISDCYLSTYANVHRGTHYLSEESSRMYESARDKVAAFIGASHSSEIVFTSGTTAAINLVAHSWGTENVTAGDEIMLSLMEHHSNIVPWQQLAARCGAAIRWAGLTADGRIDLDDFRDKLGPRTKLVALTAVSNVLGTVNPVAEICHLAHDAGVKVVVDAAQHVPHATTDVNQWGADWIAFSGHKMLGPSAIGVLYGRRELLEAMPPFLGGGGMIDRVTTSGFTAGELPGKFEAGTPPIVPAIGLSAAIDYLKQFDMQQVFRHEQQLAASAMNAMRTIDGLTVIGPESSMRAGIVSFSVEGVSSQDLAILLDQAGIAVRAGHHCTMPLHNWLGLRNSCRVSFYLYNLQSEVDFLVETLRKVISRLR